MKSFNVIITTIGRSTLQRMIDSIAVQLEPNDYLTIIWDSKPFELDINTKATVISIVNSTPLGHWGHGSRTKWQNILPGDYIVCGDDDDVFLPNAMSKIRKYCTEDKFYIFQMAYNGTVLPETHEIKLGNIGTPCGVYKPGNLPKWEFIYGGDFEFFKKLSNIKTPVFIDEVIYKIRPA